MEKGGVFNVTGAKHIHAICFIYSFIIIHLQFQRDFCDNALKETQSSTRYVPVAFRFELKHILSMVDMGLITNTTVENDLVFPSHVYFTGPVACGLPVMLLFFLLQTSNGHLCKARVHIYVTGSFLSVC